MRIFKLLCLVMSLSLLCACTSKPDYQPKDSGDGSKRMPQTEVMPEPLADSSNYSTQKIAHSYGVAKNGEANMISVNNQRYFESQGFKAFCLDTKSKNKVLYLTFDCGYENGYTAKILDVLKEKNVNAAFFCTLPQVKENPDLIRRMIDEGHIVGNHSATHPSFAEISAEEMKTEILTMDNYLRENFDYSEPYFRFPKGEYSELALKTVGDLGFTSVFWSLAYADWDLNNQKGADYAYDKVMSRLHSGAVILLHSVSPDNANALCAIIDGARQQGYEFCSLRDYNSKNSQ